MAVFPLGFTSAVFVPTQTMPTWLQGFAEHQPVTVAANALRGLMLGDDALAPGQTVAGQAGLSLAWSAALSSSPSLTMPSTGTEPELSNLHKKRRQGRREKEGQRCRSEHRLGRN
jgi:hypothetical protein